MDRRSLDVVGTDIIRTHAHGLAEAARRVPLDTPVPSCPDWTMADLVWHLTEVELFWTHVITHRPSAPDQHERPTRVGDDELIDGLERAADGLVDALTGVDPAESAWSWADEQTVGFTLRRQSHEAAVHHVDGCLAAGASLPVFSPAFAADGIDEVIGVMLTGVPEWARFERRPGVIRLQTIDTDDSWTLAFGRMIGTSPDSGTEYDLDALEPVDEAPDVTVEGAAVDLHLWLNGRGDLATLTVEGDESFAHQLRSIAASL
ncbi:MAG: maleylpyruvate isomerase family mycothiol-dependent enzyme [Ilumatobacter sp.]|nr:maleylpyruvate isomerase family mycothiol-dependent enzyme [Ilumatobacter sp.]